MAIFTVEMRDVIWTIIAIWVVYKLVDIFRASGTKKAGPYHDNSEPKNTTTLQSRKDVRSAMNKGADKEGEYVDYEEVK